LRAAPNSDQDLQDLRRGDERGQPLLLRRVSFRRLVGALGVSSRPSAVELLERSGALLTRTDLAELGLTRTMVDAVFRELAVVAFPGTRRPAVKREDYLDLVERCTYRGDRVRPT
jgi:hypothetical protein